ncbi:MAG: hypothetical protein JW847_06555 [Candidatus Omnitrophica bacterium]|nr:hypothetical protein [Candidatus Omnitrophota bacterium]
MDAWKPELWGPVFLFFLFTGCQSAAPKGNVGHVHSYPIPTIEADWIRNGDPIEFENALWYPADDIEAFIDSEMAMMGEYKGVPFYIDKVDVRPYNRIYTKFGRNQFRFFEKKKGE